MALYFQRKIDPASVTLRGCVCRVQLLAPGWSSPFEQSSGILLGVKAKKNWHYWLFQACVLSVEQNTT